jgi:hypothetical protein
MPRSVSVNLDQVQLLVLPLCAVTLPVELMS